jgi:hypothetical protein
MRIVEALAIAFPLLGKKPSSARSRRETAPSAVPSALEQTGRVLRVMTTISEI